MDRIEHLHSSGTVEYIGPESAHALAGDLVGRVFSNLIENAFEHNDEGVTVTVTIEPRDEWVVVRIRDDGAGIPERKQNRLFEPSVSGDHGYGLFLTNNLVEMYGGRLELAHTGPAGTEFTVRLLAADTAAERSERSGGLEPASFV